MRLPIIKSFILSGLFVLLLFGLSQKAEAQLTRDSALSSPDMKGRVISNTNAGISGVWVRWTDKDGKGDIRYTKTQSDGSYFFASWQDLEDQGRLDQYNTMIDTNLDGAVDSRMASITPGEDSASGFGCLENPHTITVVKPYNWAGSFSTVIFNDISNDPTELQFPDITYTPGANSASCISIDAPSQVTASQTFTATVRMKNNTIPSQWTAVNLYRLGRWDNPTNNGWVFPDGNQDRVYLQSPVNGGDTYAFSNFNVTAPNTPGTKNLETRMVQDGREWFGEICSKPITVNPVPVNSPSIQSLQIRDAVTNTQKDGKRISGLSSAQGGTGFNNPLVITLNATPGSAQSTSYYMAFYDKSGGIISNSSQFLSTVQSRLSNLSNGVFLRYDEDVNGNKKYYVWAKNQWQDITGSAAFGLPLCNAQNIPDDCNDSNRLYTVFPKSSPKQWQLVFDKNFGSKSMYTAAYVYDVNNQSAYTGGDITPQ